MKFIVILLTVILIYIEQILAATSDKKQTKSKVYFEDGSCEYSEEKIKFGGGNAGVIIKFGTSWPAIFVCRWQDPSGKYLRVRVNKGSGPVHRADPISLYLGVSQQCEPNAKFAADSFGANQKIGELSKSEFTFPAENLRVSDAIC